MLRPGESPVCLMCLKPLSAEERKYYEYRCEPCEGKAWARLQRWKAGAKDAELDALFGDKDEHA